MFLSEIRDWLKTLELGATAYYVGRLDTSKTKVIGVYPLSRGDHAEIAVSRATKTYTKPVTFLMHWTKNATETEQAALEFYEKLAESHKIIIGDTQVDYVQLLQPEPIDVSGDSDTYERTIDALFYYAK